MGSYTKMAMRFFYSTSKSILPYVEYLKIELKKSRMKISIYEYLSIALFTSLLIFLIELPVFSIVIYLFISNILLSFLISLTISSALSVFFFFVFLNYPKSVIHEKSKHLDNILPFAALYLSTIAGSKLPLYRILEIFSKFGKYGEISGEVNSMISDIKIFGMDINTAIERAIERTPSKSFKELLWGILSINKTGGDLYLFLNEKGKTYIDEYRRKLFEFSHQLTIFVEIYLTAIVLGAIFFTILTAIISSLSGVGGNIILLQFFLIFVFLPLISAAFIIIVKSMTPGSD